MMHWHRSQLLRKPHAKKTHPHRRRRQKKTISNHSEENPAEENPIFKPADSPHFQIGDDRRHHDLIDVKDFPKAWSGLKITVEVEAKAKEVAVVKLMEQLKRRCTPKKVRTKA